MRLAAIDRELEPRAALSNTYMARPRKTISPAGITCTECGEPKPASSFYRGHSSLGLTSKCKVCLTAMRNEHKAAHLAQDKSCVPAITEQTCTKCGEMKPIAEFNRDFHRRIGYQRRCRKCTNEYQRAYVAQNKEWQKQTSKRHSIKLKTLVLNAYGNMCVCCGETEKAFLCIDHIYNDGKHHRKELKKARTSFYVWLIRNNFPKDRFQILCFNCNQAKQYYGICPHKKVRVA